MTVNASTIENKITQLPQEKLLMVQKLKVGKSLFDYWIRDWYGGQLMVQDFCSSRRHGGRCTNC
jgi:hypothetical protein